MDGSRRCSGPVDQSVSCSLWGSVSVCTCTHLLLYIQSPPQYWNSKVNSFVFARHCRQLSLRSNDVHEMTDLNFNLKFSRRLSPGIFFSRFVKQLGTPFESDHPIFWWEGVFEHVTDRCFLLPRCVLLDWLVKKLIVLNVYLVLALDFACEDCICVERKTSMKTRELSFLSFKMACFARKEGSEPLLKHWG